MTTAQSYQQYGVGPINGVLSLFGIKPSKNSIGDLNQKLADCSTGLLPIESCAAFQTDVGKILKSLKDASDGSNLSIVSNGASRRKRFRRERNQVLNEEERALYKKATDPKNKNREKAKKEFSDRMQIKRSPKNFRFLKTISKRCTF